MFKRILVPLDGSESAESILNLVGFIASSSKAEIVLLRVVEYPYHIYASWTGYNPFDSAQMERLQGQKEAFRLEIDDYLSRVASVVAENGIKVATKVCEGPVVESILSSSENLRADLIVLSTCGNGGGNPWMIGAVANRVLREAKVPVILIRTASIKPIPHFLHKQDRPFHQALKTDHYGSRVDTAVASAEMTAL